MVSEDILDLDSDQGMTEHHEIYTHQNQKKKLKHSHSFMVTVYNMFVPVR